MSKTKSLLNSAVGLSSLVLILSFSPSCQNDRQKSVPNDKSAAIPASVETAAPPLELKTENGMTLLPGGEFLMGAENEMPHESPVHKVRLKPFWIDRTEVTVTEFERFVAATGYKTEAEKFGWSGVFDIEESGWTKVDGANWRDPFGDGSKPKHNEPVTQVSWNDAAVYAKWAGKRLPTEAEWEYAARGNLVGKKYGWGDELKPKGKPVANWWQGNFPDKNTGEDGFVKTAPVGSFPPNAFGLSDMIGNV